MGLTGAMLAAAGAVRGREEWRTGIPNNDGVEASTKTAVVTRPGKCRKRDNESKGHDCRVLTHCCSEESDALARGCGYQYMTCLSARFGALVCRADGKARCNWRTRVRERPKQRMTISAGRELQ